MVARRSLLAACLAALALGAAACGNKDHEPGTGGEPAREGLSVQLDGVEYNIGITRQLNLRVQPDQAYYKGPEPGQGETLYGVFMQVCNRSKSETRQTATEFRVVDNQHNEFGPVELPEDNQFAYHARELPPRTCIPEAGSVAALGPAASSLVLFKLPLQTTENRPLELEVGAPSGRKRTFELDL
jgi:hypothetical protein